MQVGQFALLGANLLTGVYYTNKLYAPAPDPIAAATAAAAATTAAAAAAVAVPPLAATAKVETKKTWQ